ncbi:MAG: GH92 family glycosyl hydrolase [Planctomycetaceae bacterium]
MKKTALGPTVNSRFSGRAGVEDYNKYGYCPNDLMEQSVARTLEYCYADAAIARLAAALGHADDARLFEQHAARYRQLWNPATQYFHPRDSNGEFSKDFQPLLLTYLDFQKKFTRAYVEGSALQWRWAVPQDPEGLIGLFKDREYFVTELNEFFAKSVPQVGVVPNAYYWQGNQPDLFAPFLFNTAGRPDLTQKWVRWILDKKYGDQANGLDGNDDGGTLSAWYVFAALGFYPVAGTDRYELASPLFSRAEVKLGEHRLVIQADNNSAKNVAVRRILLHGQPLERHFLNHADIAQGGTLQFEMGPPLP